MQANSRPRVHRQRRGQQGFSLIELMIVIAIIGILIGVGIPAWQNSIRSTNETAALQTLRTIGVEQRIYYNSHNRSTYGTFDQMIADGSLDKRYAGDSPTVDGYIFKIEVTPKAGNQQAMYRVYANPQKPDGVTATGRQFFYVDSNSGTIHVNLTQQAGPDDPPVGG